MRSMDMRSCVWKNEVICTKKEKLLIYVGAFFVKNAPEMSFHTPLVCPIKLLNPWWRVVASQSGANAAVVDMSSTLWCSLMA
jgi:hypothetical protein